MDSSSFPANWNRSTVIVHSNYSSDLEDIEESSEISFGGSSLSQIVTENEESSLTSSTVSNTESSLAAVLGDERVVIEKYVSFVWIVSIGILFVTGVFFLGYSMHLEVNVLTPRKKGTPSQTAACDNYL
jgi:hypothetical protein